MNYLRLKPGVQFAAWTPALLRILAAAAGCAKTLAHDLTITCGSEGHKPLDPHTLGLAIDVRTSDLTDSQASMALATIRADLGGDFTVLYESPDPDPSMAPVTTLDAATTAPHLHIQLRRGLTAHWPDPAPAGLAAVLA